MKLLLIIFSILLLGIVACERSDQKSNNTTTQRSGENLRQITFTVPEADTPVRHSVPLATARVMVKDYQTTAGTVTRPRMEGGGTETVPNTRSVWFSDDQLISMLERLQEEGGDGIRVYFTKYGNAEYVTVDGVKQNYSLQNTLLFVSTRYVSDSNIHRDYYSDGSIKRGFRFIPENKGEICPPPKNCFNKGATLDIITN